MRKDYKVTGIARDGSDLQELLKGFFEDDLETGSYSRSHEARFEEYDDGGAKALAVFADDTEIGSIKGEDVSEILELAGKAEDLTVTFGINGHDIDEYEKIIDRYKDKKFWKEEDPDFDDKAVNKAYNDLMAGLKEGSVYQAELNVLLEDEPEKEPEAVLTEEEQKNKGNMDLFVKYFKILFPMSVLLVVIGIVYLIKLSTIMGILNLFFGALGMYFSWKYTKQKRSFKEKFKKDDSPK